MAQNRSLEPGARFSHYEVKSFIGAGGMGEVYLAEDLKLGRRVAVKVVRPGAAPQARARLLLEAQTMAKLSHRNVVTVFGVEENGPDVLVIMEHIEGVTAGRWLGERPRSWREILEVFVAAGRGLAAAHRAGVVHRDFKPDNVLVGTDRQVRVSDFGLARAFEDDRTVEAAGDSPALSGSGGLAGTPAYMAPEQHLLRPADARADQFAFCVSLYRALYGTAPFAGENYVELYDNVVAGRLREPPRAAGVPARIRRLLRTGLADDPAARHPSVAALVDELERDTRAPAYRALVALALAAAAGLAALAWTRGAGVAPCQGAGRALAGVWDAGRKQEVSRAFAATGRGHAEDTFRRAAAILDDYAGGWTAARTDACQATAVRHEQSPALLDLRMACLDRRRGALAGLASVFAGADGAVIDKAVVAATNLPSLASCADTAALTAIVPPPEDREVRARVAGLQPRVDALQGLFLSGRYQAGLALARSVAAEAMSVPYPELQAEALELQAMFEGPDRPAREATQRRVAEVAARAKDDLRGARAWVGIAEIVESDKARAAEVAPTRLALEAALQRAGDPPKLRAIVLLDRAYALEAMSKTDEAAELIAQAIATYGRDPKPDQVEMAKAMNLRAYIAENRGNTAEALAEFERARVIWENHLGVDHPNVAIALNNIAECYMDMGKNAEAIAALEKARTIQERSLPPDSPVLARTLESMAAVLISDHKHDEALALLRRALAINEKLVGQDRRSLGTTARKIGDVLAQKGDIDAAIPYFARAVSVHTEAIGPESPNVASAESAWGAALRQAKRFAEARTHLERALVLRQKVHGRDNPILLHTLLHLGALARQEDRSADALALDQQSLHIAQKSWRDDNPQKASLYHAVAEDMMLLGRFGDALPLYQQALAIQQRALPPDHFDFAPVLMGLGECQLELGRPAEALAPLERAIKIAEPTQKPSDLARPRFALARALWDSGGDRARATDLAKQARAAFAPEGPNEKRRMARIRAWFTAKRI